ncbi:hypothetical protein GA0115246_101681, partial [Streptomyces sp. SolWspMP-sol7th]
MATARDQPIPGQVAGRDATRPREDTPASAQDEPARDGAQDGQGVSAAPALR